MSRKLVVPVAILMLFSFACGSFNQPTPRGIDDKAIEADVRGKILEAVPSNAFAVDVKVDHGVVTLSGWTKNEEDRHKIGEAADKVHGVRTVINNITIQS
jgi:osmotically-inducible protein OsmY